MKDIRTIKLFLTPADDGGYIASYHAEVQQAVYTVSVKDNIFGALALHSFAEMIKKQFGKHYTAGEIEFILPDSLAAESKPLHDVLMCESAFCA